ncbi:diguanylate cyclase [Coxiella burnetii]|nr:transcriptional regulatory protein [Coxiella burnetii Dugway 5J108-111]ABX77987.1 sensory box protein [Coxiella burnetii RSA 331]AML48066.1 diguanylate cyclase [Coxiella burnetii]AML54089.1 diguanylate cyclase [Coxiella burnetii]ARK28218.1 diguanylate cyclase [Coxiella burnetii]
MKDNLIDQLGLKMDKAIVIADHCGLITYVNAEFEQLFGWRSQEIINQPVLTIIPSRFHDAHNIGFSRLVVTEQSLSLNRPFNLVGVKKSGEEFNAVHVFRAIKTNGEWIIGANIFLPNENFVS